LRILVLSLFLKWADLGHRGGSERISVVLAWKCLIASWHQFGWGYRSGWRFNSPACHRFGYDRTQSHPHHDECECERGRYRDSDCFAHYDLVPELLASARPAAFRSVASCLRDPPHTCCEARW